MTDRADVRSTDPIRSAAGAPFQSSTRLLTSSLPERRVAPNLMEVRVPKEDDSFLSNHLGTARPPHRVYTPENPAKAQHTQRHGHGPRAAPEAVAAGPKAELTNDLARLRDLGQAPARAAPALSLGPSRPEREGLGGLRRDRFQGFLALLAVSASAALRVSASPAALNLRARDAVRGRRSCRRGPCSRRHAGVSGRGVTARFQKPESCGSQQQQGTGACTLTPALLWLLTNSLKPR